MNYTNMRSRPLFEISINGHVSTNSGKEMIKNWRHVLERHFASLHCSNERRKLSVILQFWIAPDRIYRMQRNDLDNLSKPVLDAMKRTGVIHDDAEIFHLESTKFPTSGEEGVYIVIKELNRYS